LRQVRRQVARVISVIRAQEIEAWHAQQAAVGADR
jgi:hypothetical protein